MTDDAPEMPEPRPSRSSEPVARGDLEGLFEALEERIEARERTPWGRLRAWTEGMSLPLRRAWLLAFALGLPLAMLVRPRPDLHALLGEPPMLVALFCAAVAVPLGMHALRGWHVASPSRATAALWMLGSVVGLGVLLLASTGGHGPHAGIPAGLAPWQHVMPCLLAGLTFALPVYGAARLLGRGSPRSGLFAAAMAGLSGNLALVLHCGIGEATHLLLAHGGVLVALLAGAVVAVARGTNARRPV